MLYNVTKKNIKYCKIFTLWKKRYQSISGREHGDEPFIQIIISRNVVNSIITGTLKVISPQFREMNGNDKLYHLKVLIKTSHSNLSLEKNEVILISPKKWKINVRI